MGRVGGASPATQPDREILYSVILKGVDALRNHNVIMVPLVGGTRSPWGPTTANTVDHQQKFQGDNHSVL